ASIVRSDEAIGSTLFVERGRPTKSTSSSFAVSLFQFFAENDGHCRIKSHSTNHFPQGNSRSIRGPISPAIVVGSLYKWAALRKIVDSRAYSYRHAALNSLSTTSPCR